MGFLSKLKKDVENAKREKASQINGKNLKKLLKQFKEERDRVEKETGVRPQIDSSTQMFMQKILNVWISEGKIIDEEKFWIEVDYNRQFTHPVEYYEIIR
jgi:pyruvate/oxaloacetate carboxyltransferase